MKRLIVALGLIPTMSYAAGSTINYYHLITEALSLDAKYGLVVGSAFVTVILAFIGMLYKAQLNSQNDVLPTSRVGIRFFIDLIMNFIYGLAQEHCGKNYRNYLSILSALFLFIYVANLSGLVPGFPPPTESMSTNFALGIVAFGVYNLAGFREHGIGYLKQLLGPVAFIAPLFLVLETISHLSRPFSLGMRLTGNIFGDHLLLSVFSSLTYLVIPAALLFFGLLISTIQSFVFTLLTGIYISMAISHDH